MGDPKKLRKRYQTRRHPWKEEIIKKDKVLTKGYSLKNKKEVWGMDYVLKKMKDEAKRLIAARSEQGEIEKGQLLKRLMRYGLIDEPHLEKVLDISIEQIADRRLQSLVYTKRLAKSMNQARQFIVHGHIAIGGKKIAHPNYLVTLEEEPHLRFNQLSSLANEEHPERAVSISRLTEGLAGRSDDDSGAESAEDKKSEEDILISESAADSEKISKDTKKDDKESNEEENEGIKNNDTDDIKKDDNKEDIEENKT